MLVEGTITDGERDLNVHDLSALRISARNIFSPYFRVVRDIHPSRTYIFFGD